MKDPQSVILGAVLGGVGGMIFKRVKALQESEMPVNAGKVVDEVTPRPIPGSGRSLPLTSDSVPGVGRVPSPGAAAAAAAAAARPESVMGRQFFQSFEANPSSAPME